MAEELLCLSGVSVIVTD